MYQKTSKNHTFLSTLPRVVSRPPALKWSACASVRRGAGKTPWGSSGSCRSPKESWDNRRGGVCECCAWGLSFFGVGITHFLFLCGFKGKATGSTIPGLTNCQVGASVPFQTRPGPAGTSKRSRQRWAPFAAEAVGGRRAGCLQRSPPPKRKTGGGCCFLVSL